MNSLLLSISARYLMWPLLLLSLVILYRGHNLPGGGFIGGLIAASPFALIMLADGVRRARLKLCFSPVSFIAAGVAIAGVSGLLAFLGGEVLMKGLWLPGFTLPVLGKVHLGSPLLFDIGVYLAVIGFITNVLFSFEEDSLEEGEESEGTL